MRLAPRFLITPLFIGLLFTIHGSAFALPHVANEVVSGQMQSENAPQKESVAPTKPTTTTATTDKKTAATVAPATGYFEVIGGAGLTRLRMGKSYLGISPSESDWLSESNNHWQSPFVHLGVGYVYYLGDPIKGYAEKFTWFSSIEPMLNLYYYNFNAKGNVIRFNNPDFNDARFIMPIHTYSLMLDVALTIAAYKRFTLYLLGGVGNAWSQMGYKDMPNTGNTTARPGLSLNTLSQSNSVYEGGLGITAAINPRIALGLQYLTTHVGNIRASSSGNLGGVPTKVAPPGFSLRTNTYMLDLHVALS